MVNLSLESVENLKIILINLIFNSILHSSRIISSMYHLPTYIIAYLIYVFNYLCVTKICYRIDIN
jgi:hypothetical protein